MDKEIARWCFEDGALQADSIGNNDLTLIGNPVASLDDKQEGTSSLVLASGQYASIADTSLENGFPLKIGDQQRTMSLAIWFKTTITLSTAGGLQALFSKGPNFILLIKGPHLVLQWGYLGGLETFTFPYQISPEQWYHVLVALDGRNRRLLIAIYNDTNRGQLLWQLRPRHELLVEADPIYLGRDADNNNFQGYLDEIRIFNYPLQSTAQLAIASHLFHVANPILSPEPISESPQGWRWNENYWR
jgi:hypothetical protein